MTEFYSGYLFDVSKSAKILHVKSENDEEYFKSFYKGSCENVAKDFDALHIEYSYIEGIKKQATLPTV